ncbi:MAG: hypothetical protein PHD23_06790 [Eubacteriales bacterium]|nr:hypothetical protein [Eubacteriales bacterium]
MVVDSCRWLSIVVDMRAYLRDTLDYACLHLPSLDVVWTRLDIPAKAPITQQCQTS